MTITKTKGLLIFAGILLMFPVFTSGQAASATCGDRTTLLKALHEKYKESPRALGLASSGKAMFEVYTSENGTWTILMTTAKGVTCVMAAGHSWQEALEVVEGPEV